MKREQGYSVPLVLVLLAVITALALAAAQRTMGHRTQAAGFAERIRTRHAALSGINAGKYLLAIDRTPWDGPGDSWYDGLTFTLNGAGVAVEIIDEQGAISINHLMLPSGEPNPPLEKAMAKLFPEIPRPGEQWQEFLANRFMNGAVRSVSRDGFSVFLSQCAGTVSTSANADERISQCLTSFGQGRVNLNTASPDVLKALGGNALERAVVVRRAAGSLESIFQIDDAVENLRGLINVTDVRSAFFRIRTTATGTFVTCHAETVIWRRNNRLTVLRHREWWS